MSFGPETETWEPIHPPEPTDRKPRYRLLRVAFALGAISLGLLGLSGACEVMAYLGDRDILNVVRSDLWDWMVGAPITWGSLFASFVLLGPFADLRWRRLAVLLLVMNAVDLGVWWLEHADAMGFRGNAIAPGQGGLLLATGRLLNLSELFVFGYLAREVLIHLERPESARAFDLVYWSVFTGIALHLLFCLNLIHWQHGGGFRFVPRIRNVETFFIYLAGIVAQTVSAFAVSYLCIQACHQSSQMLGELAESEKKDGPFGP